MTLQARTRLALALVIVAFVILGALVTSTMRGATEVRNQTTKVLYPAGELISEILLANTDMERGVWGYAISEDPVFLTSYVVGRVQAQQGYSDLRELLANGNADLLPLLEQAAIGWRNWDTAVAEPLIAKVRTGDGETARATIASGNGRRAFTHVRSDLTLLNDTVAARTAESVERLTTTNRTLAMALLATAFALVLFTAAATVANVRWVIGPLGDLADQMRRITRTGDTISPLQPGGPPEIAALGRDAELLRQSLVSQIDTAIEATEGLAQEGPAVATLRGLLRGPAVPRVPGFGIGVSSLASEGALTGDWWDAITLTNGADRRRHILEVCDIAGHDAVAGVVAARFKAALHAGLRNGATTPDALAYASATFTRIPHKFASYVAVELDHDTVDYLNAGHNPPVLVRRSGTVETFEGTGPLVTSMPGGRWVTAQTTMTTGDVLVLYTDGLVEARDARDVEIGERQLIAWSRDLCAESATEPAPQRSRYIAQGLRDRARAHTVDLRRDDVTVIVAVRE